MEAGQRVDLAVQVQPGEPVTFGSVDAGAFADSNLSTTSVRADADGIARVTFLQAPGTTNRCRILATSPLSSGQARFTVVFASPAR